MTALIVFGLLHAHLLWSGDVLFSYGVVGLFAYLARRLTPRRLIITGILLHGVSSLIFVGQGLFLRSAPPEVISATIDTNAVGVKAGKLELRFNEVVAERPAVSGGPGAPASLDGPSASPAARPCVPGEGALVWGAAPAGG